MLFSIFSGIYDRFLYFRCVLHSFYYWPVCELNVNSHKNDKKGNF